MKPSGILAEEGRWPPASLLGRLPESTRTALLDLGHQGDFTPGEVMIREGETSAHVLLIMAGLVKVEGTTPQGHKTLLAIRAPGDVVGELAAIDASPRSASVVAVTRTSVRSISGQQFLQFLARHPEVSLELTRVVTEKLRSATRARVAAGGYPVLVRVARVLAELAGSYGRETAGGRLIDFPLAQSDLSALVGASEAAVHKALRTLRNQGAITTDYRRIVIADAAALAAIAEGD